jgi:hypothetical protein
MKHAWTAQDVEAETQAGYFSVWQGDNARLNAWNKSRPGRNYYHAWRALLAPPPPESEPPPPPPPPPKPPRPPPTAAEQLDMDRRRTALWRGWDMSRAEQWSDEELRHLDLLIERERLMRAL